MVGRGHSVQSPLHVPSPSRSHAAERKCRTQNPEHVPKIEANLCERNLDAQTRRVGKAGRTVGPKTVVQKLASGTPVKLFSIAQTS